MRYNYLIFSINIFLCVNVNWASPEQPIAKDDRMPDYTSGKTPWRCPQSIKLLYVLTKLQHSLENESSNSVKKEEYINELKQRITQTQEEMDAYARASYR